jgi:hypothetical protein
MYYLKETSFQESDITKERKNKIKEMLNENKSNLKIKNF